MGLYAPVWAWGDNTHGAIGGGQYLVEKTPIDIGFSNVIQIAADFFHSAAIRADCTLWTWGNPTFVPSTLGRPTTPVPTNRPDEPRQVLLQDPASGPTLALQVSVGAGHSLAVAVTAGTVPDVRGDSLAQATQALAADGLTLGRQTFVTDCDHPSTVSSQTPSPNATVPLGSPVHLRIGRKPTKVVCP